MAAIHIDSINAVTLAVHDMSRSVRFYTALGSLCTTAASMPHLPAYTQAPAISI